MDSLVDFSLENLQIQLRILRSSKNHSAKEMGHMIPIATILLSKKFLALSKLPLKPRASADDLAKKLANLLMVLPVYLGYFSGKITQRFMVNHVNSKIAEDRTSGPFEMFLMNKNFFFFATC